MKYHLLAFLLMPFLCFSQTEKVRIGPMDTIRVRAIVFEGDTIPFTTLPVVVCTGKRNFKNKRQAAQWSKLLYNVKKAYPYAILAAARLKEYDRKLATMKDEKERKEYMKVAEKEIQKEFGEELKNLTVTQGKILIKLIDRETGKTSYELVKELRGSFSAFMWQSLALMFNNNLKSEYDGGNEDKAIEQAIWLIENGYY